MRLHPGKARLQVVHSRNHCIQVCKVHLQQSDYLLQWFYVFRDQIGRKYRLDFDHVRRLHPLLRQSQPVSLDYQYFRIRSLSNREYGLQALPFHH